MRFYYLAHSDCINKTSSGEEAQVGGARQLHAAWVHVHGFDLHQIRLCVHERPRMSRQSTALACAPDCRLPRVGYAQLVLPRARIKTEHFNGVE